MAKAPNNMSLRNNLALSLTLGGDHQRAIGLLQETANNFAAGPRLHQNLALVYALGGQIDRAAAVPRADLTEREAQSNLAFYRSLQRLSGQDLAAAVIGLRASGAKTTRKTAAPDTPPSTITPDRDESGIVENGEPAPSHGDRSSADDGALSRDTVAPPSDIGQPEETPVANTLIITRRSNLRAEPGVASDILTVLKPGQRIERSEATPVKGYYRVAYNNREGWVWSRNVGTEVAKTSADNPSGAAPGLAGPLVLKLAGKNGLGAAENRRERDAPPQALAPDRSVAVLGAVPAPNLSRQENTVPRRPVVAAARPPVSPGEKPVDQRAVLNTTNGETSGSDKGADRGQAPGLETAAGEKAPRGTTPWPDPTSGLGRAVDNMVLASVSGVSAMGSRAAADREASTEAVNTSVWQPTEPTPQQVNVSGNERRPVLKAKESEETFVSPVTKFFGFGYNSATNPKELTAYCERNRETWVYDNGTGRFVFCRNHKGKGSNGYLMAGR